MSKVLFITKPFKIEMLGIMYLSAAAKKAGHNTQITTTKSVDEVLSTLTTFNPDIVAYSIMTGDQEYFDDINKAVKRVSPQIISIAGGPHPTFFHQEWVSSFDAYCVGEGEEAFVDYIEHPARHNDNISSMFTGKFIMRPLVKDLDTLPFPDRDLVFQYPHIKNGPIKHFIASRGCPYDCSYCFNKAYGELYPGQPRVRFRSVANVIEEIQYVNNNQSPIEFVYFQDDTFILNKKWLAEFCCEYRKRFARPFHCHTRANLVDDEVVQMLSEAGCYSVHLAAEAGNPCVREKILNRRMSNETIVNAVRKMEDGGIRVMLQNIIGLPGTTLADDIETLKLNIECDPTYSWVSIFQPYPKTQLGKYAQEIGQYKGDFSNLQNNFFDQSPLDIPQKNEVENLQRLFAFVVKHPDIYRSGLLDTLLRLPVEQVKEKYTKIYNETRSKSDELLYGMKL